MEPDLLASSGLVGPAPPLAAEVFHRRRERLIERCGGGAVVVPAAPELFRPRDGEVPYRPGSDLLYLTGFREPEAVAVLIAGSNGPHLSFFVRARDPEREVWTGPRAGVEGARERYGADEAYTIDQLDALLPRLVSGADAVLAPLGTDTELDDRLLALLNHARRGRQRSGGGVGALVDLEPVLGEMRRVKGQEEIERIRVAAAIAARGHLAGMRAARPGAGEWEIEAAVDGTMRALGAAGPSYPTIVGSGVNATVLHYTANDRRARDGDLVLVDAGAIWGDYCSDITRTFPLSGRFTPEQRELYDIVLAAEGAGIAAARPGEPVAAVHEAAVRALVAGLLHLGILEAASIDAAIDDGSFRRFYPHQTSHWLGLDVHDVGLYREGDRPATLEPGMVLTVEPGLYFPDAPDVPDRWRGIGIRIEDDVLVTEGGNELLTRDVPVEAEAVEALVSSANAAPVGSREA